MVELAPTTPEQRAEIYADVRSLIVPGFLAHHVAVGETRLCLRSLDAADWDLLRYRVHGLAGQRWKAWVVASSVWMVNGAVLLGSEEDVCALAQMCESLPKTVLDMLYSTVNGLMRRVLKGTEILEGFLYENESRQLWRTEGPAIRDRRGRFAQRFYNPVISLWIYYNEMEDHRERDEHEWQIAKFVASPHAPKGVKKITAKDKQRLGDMMKRRQRVMDRAYYEAKGLVERRREGKPAASIRARDDVRMAETPEELREVMRRWVAGIKDDHDRVVDQAKARIKHEVESRRSEAAKRREALDRALEDEGFTRSQPLPLSGEAGKKFLERMRSRLPGASVVVDDHTHNRAYAKYIENNPEVGDLAVDDEGNLFSKSPVSAEMLDVLRKPDATERPTLQQQIERRKPTAELVDDGEEG